MTVLQQGAGLPSSCCLCEASLSQAILGFYAVIKGTDDDPCFVGFAAAMPQDPSRTQQGWQLLLRTP